MIEGILGLLAGILSIALARAFKGESWMYSASLVALPGIYIFFALYAGEHTIGVKELIVGAPFIFVGIVLAVLSVPMSATIVGALWLLHGIYDLAHDRFFTNPGVPSWYPIFCASVDIVIGLYLLWLSVRLTKSNLHAV